MWSGSRWIVGRGHSLQCNWMQRDMNEHEEIAKALKARLSELRTHLAKVDRSLRKPLPADSEDQAIELENQEALEAIEKTETVEIHQIEAALKRIAEGTYGTCAKTSQQGRRTRKALTACSTPPRSRRTAAPRLPSGLVKDRATKSISGRPITGALPTWAPWAAGTRFGRGSSATRRGER